jgi:creatinine amidohydrolase
MVGPEAAKIRESGQGGCGGHADELETSLMLYLQPQAVDMSKATAVDTVDYHSRFFSGDSFVPALKTTWSTWDIHPSRTGVHGDPTSATAEKGRRLFEAIVGNSCEFFAEFYRHPGAQQ